jgi:hypothetical protein
MSGKRRSFLGVFISVGFLLTVSLSSWAEVRLNKTPPPPPTAKLRVFVLPLTGSPPPNGWTKPHAEFARNQFRATRTTLEGTGIYEMPTREEVRAVVGQQVFTPSDWKKNGWALPKQVGQALFADYVFVVERDFNSGFKFFQTLLMNLATGKEFRVSFRVPKGREHRDEWQQIGRVAYAELFREAKNDMLATALRKGHPSRGPSLREPERAVPFPPKAREVDLEAALKQDGRQPGPRLAVYDFSAGESYKVVGPNPFRGAAGRDFPPGDFHPGQPGEYRPDHE